MNRNLPTVQIEYTNGGVTRKTVQNLRNLVKVHTSGRCLNEHGHLLTINPGKIDGRVVVYVHQGNMHSAYNLNGEYVQGGTLTRREGRPPKGLKKKQPTELEQLDPELRKISTKSAKPKDLSKKELAEATGQADAKKAQQEEKEAEEAEKKERERKRKEEF